MAELTPAAVAERAAALRAASPALAALPPARRAAAVAAAAATLADPGSELGREARRELPATTGLSPAMVDWALRTSLEGWTVAAVIRLLADAGAVEGSSADASALPRSRPVRIAVVVLAGNLFTAAVPPLFLAVAAGAPVLAKASSREDRFPRLLARALAEADEEVGRAVGVVAFPGGSEALEAPLYAAAEVVQVFGSDATVEAVRRRLPRSVRLIGRGHGVGAAWVPATAAAEEDDLRLSAAALALDVAAYDQRGCLSPATVWVEGDGAAAERVGRALAAALECREEELPRGRPPSPVAATQTQWRGVAAATGILLGPPTGGGVAPDAPFAVAVASVPLPATPGWRNVAVHPCSGLGELGRRLAPLAEHLKVLGVAGGEAERREAAAALAPAEALSPRVVPAGTMQTPPPGVPADGLPPFEGLLRPAAAGAERPPSAGSPGEDSPAGRR